MQSCEHNSALPAPLQSQTKFSTNHKQSAQAAGAPSQKNELPPQPSLHSGKSLGKQEAPLPKGKPQLQIKQIKDSRKSGRSSERSAKLISPVKQQVARPQPPDVAILEVDRAPLAPSKEDPAREAILTQENHAEKFEVQESRSSIRPEIMLSSDVNDSAQLLAPKPINEPREPSATRVWRAKQASRSRSPTSRRMEIGEAVLAS